MSRYLMSRYLLSRYLVSPYFTLSLLALILCQALSPNLFAQDSSFKEEVQTTVSDTVNASKDFFSGLVAGIEGQPEIDPSHVVANKADLAGLLKVEVFDPKDLKNGNWLITVALRNKAEFPVHVTNLSALGQVVILDADGFAYPLVDRQAQGQDLVVLARSAARVRFNFKDLESRPTVFRVYDTDFPIP